MRLMAYLGMFKKSPKVSACNFDPKGLMNAGPFPQKLDASVLILNITQFLRC